MSNHSKESWKTIYRGYDPVFLQTLAELLRKEGFELHTSAVGSPALLGAGNFIFEQQIRVPRERADEAQKVLGAFLEAETPADENMNPSVPVEAQQKEQRRSSLSYLPLPKRSIWKTLALSLALPGFAAGLFYVRSKWVAAPLLCGQLIHLFSGLLAWQDSWQQLLAGWFLFFLCDVVAAQAHRHRDGRNQRELMDLSLGTAGALLCVTLAEPLAAAFM